MVSLRGATLYERIYAVVAQIPAGRVATYGQIAGIVGRCSPRTVGYAMAACPAHLAVPWQRVINSQGRISLRRSGDGGTRQRRMLEDEGVAFDPRGRVDFGAVAWHGPDWRWLERNGCHVVPPAGA